MNEQEILGKLREGLEKSKTNLVSNLNSIRAGRANPALLDKVTVIYYDTPTPLKSLANISAPDGSTLIVTPFDANALKDIEKGISDANLGVSTSNDGKVIRLSVPPLTEEKRKEFAKEVKTYGEEAKIAIRSSRNDANKRFKALKEEGEFTEDDLKSSEKGVQKLVDEAAHSIDKLVSEKEQEILSL